MLQECKDIFNVPQIQVRSKNAKTSLMYHNSKYASRKQRQLNCTTIPSTLQERKDTSSLIAKAKLSATFWKTLQSFKSEEKSKIWQILRNIIFKKKYFLEKDSTNHIRIPTFSKYTIIKWLV